MRSSRRLVTANQGACKIVCSEGNAIAFGSTCWFHILCYCTHSFAVSMCVRCGGACEQVQFISRGPAGVGRVSADMYQDASRQWQFYYLLVDVDGGRGRISIVHPQYQ